MSIIKSVLLLFLTLHAVIAIPTDSDVEKYGQIRLYRSDPQVAVVATAYSRFSPIGQPLEISVPWNFRIVNSFYQDEARLKQSGISVDASSALVTFRIEGIPGGIILAPEDSIELLKNGNNVYVFVDRLPPDYYTPLDVAYPVLSIDEFTGRVRRHIGSLPAAPFHQKFQQKGHLEVKVAGQCAIRILPVGDVADRTNLPRFTHDPQYIVPSTGVTGESSRGH